MFCVHLLVAAVKSVTSVIFCGLSLCKQTADIFIDKERIFRGSRYNLQHRDMFSPRYNKLLASQTTD